MNTVRLNTQFLRSICAVLRMSAAELISISGIPCTTWYAMIGKVEGITIQQLLAIANAAHVPVRRFFSYDKTDVVGRREDYVVDEKLYKPCHYDGQLLQQMVSTNPDTTWKKAADATGMNYQRLKDSLLAVRRTPVARFLTVCQAFGIDPFTILIDPNPEPKRTRRSPNPVSSGLSASPDEIASLRSDIASLHAEILDLRNKYEALLSDHRRLASRVNTNIGSFNNNCNFSIAAEPEQ